MEEIEVKFLNIDVPALEEKLRKLGAVKAGDYMYKRKTYDFADASLSSKGAWVRLRDEGDKVTFTYKQRFGAETNALKDGGTKEIEVTVSDFATADQLLKAIGLVEKFYEENKRTRYTLGSIEFDIDTWPLLPPYLEIEGSDWASVESIARALGFNWDDHIRCQTMQVYALNGINENDYSILTFENQIKKSL